MAYKVVGTHESATLNNGDKVRPLVSLEDEHGGVSHIIEDDHCFVLVNGSKDRKYQMVYYWYDAAALALADYLTPKATEERGEQAQLEQAHGYLDETGMATRPAVLAPGTGARLFHRLQWMVDEISTLRGNSMALQTRVKELETEVEEKDKKLADVNELLNELVELQRIEELADERETRKEPTKCPFCSSRLVIGCTFQFICGTIRYRNIAKPIQSSRCRISQLETELKAEVARLKEEIGF